MEDTKARVVVVASKALPAYLEANSRLAEEARVQHILVLDAEPGQKLPPGVSSFRDLYQDDGSQCPETLPGESFISFMRTKTSLSRCLLLVLTLCWVTTLAGGI